MTQPQVLTTALTMGRHTAPMKPWCYSGPPWPEGESPGDGDGDEQRVFDEMRLIDGEVIPWRKKFVRLWTALRRR